MTNEEARIERRRLMAERNDAYARGDVAAANECTRRLVDLPMPGVAALTAADRRRWDAKR
jgi:hypothetical protein